jgi:hypothetical protein
MCLRQRTADHVCVLPHPLRARLAAANHPLAFFAAVLACCTRLVSCHQCQLLDSCVGILVDVAY